MMKQIESKDKDANRRYMNRILQRLGIEDEVNEEYDIYMLENDIMNDIIDGDYTSAGEKMSEYNRRVKDNRVSLQFAAAMTAWIMKKQNVSNEELSDIYIRAIRYTVPDFGCDIEPYLLSCQEYNLILEYYNCMQDQMSERCILKMIDKIDNSCLNEYSKAKLYPKIVIYLSLRNAALKKIDDKKLIELGEKALRMLAASGKMYYISEMLNVHNNNLLRYIEKHSNEDVGEYKLQRMKTLQYIRTIESIAAECNIDIKKGDDRYFYEQRGIYSIADVVKTRRIMFGMTREELSEDICSVKTIMRIENRKDNVRKEILRKIFVKLHLAPEFTRTEAITSQRKAMEYEQRWNNAICREESYNAELMQQELHNYKWEELIENRQCFENKIMITKIQSCKIEPDKAEQELKKILGYTVPYDYVDKEKCYFTKTEMISLYTIATLDKDKRVKRLKRLIDIIENEKCKAPISNRISLYEIISIAYASELGNRERYDESNQYSIGIMNESIRNNRMFYLESSEYSIIWNYMQRTPEANLDCGYIEERIDNCITMAELKKKDKKIEFYKQKKELWIPH